MYEKSESVASLLVNHPIHKWLTFILRLEYPGANQDPENPLEGTSLKMNTFMYICGASIDVQAMTTFAVKRINQATEIISALVPHHYPNDLSRLFLPLRDALSMVFEQPDIPEMRPIRVALARLIDNVLVWLMGSPSFRSHFDYTWFPWVYYNCMSDNHRFRSAGDLPLIRLDFGWMVDLDFPCMVEWINRDRPPAIDLSRTN
jgi:hypothetical protein